MNAYVYDLMEWSFLKYKNYLTILSNGDRLHQPPGNVVAVPRMKCRYHDDAHDVLATYHMLEHKQLEPLKQLLLVHDDNDALALVRLPLYG